MGWKQDIVGTRVYIDRANKRIGKARHLIGHSPNRETVATARELVDVLTRLLANVEHTHQRLQRTADTARQ